MVRIELTAGKNHWAGLVFVREEKRENKFSLICENFVTENNVERNFSH